MTAKEECPSFEVCQERINVEGSDQPALKDHLLTESLVRKTYEHWKKRRYLENGGNYIQPILRVCFLLLFLFRSCNLSKPVN